MATYYLSSSNQRDALPTPYLPRQKLELDSYHDPPSVPDNMMYLNHASNSASYSELLSGSSLSPYNSVEIPSVGEESFQYQELSLSLGMQIPSSIHLPSFQYHYTNPSPFYSLSSHVPDSEEHGSQSKKLRKGEYLSTDLAGDGCNTIEIGSLNNPQFSVSPKEVQSASNLYEPSGLGYTISNSNYLKAAQQLLDEVVHVHEALKQPKSDKHQNFNKFDSSTNGSVDDLHESTANTSGELSPAERQDLQSKMTKLSSMLDEVDKRYKQYYHQMQTVEASFDMVAGCGAAKPYTRLALHTISRQFRILRDAINGHIQVISRSLGEQYDTLDGRVLPRLRYVDKQLRQQRILQQLGVVHHSWRPQRGLPESSVLILRAWLFEHFLHPYPKDSEKIMLARQAGLTRSQVANWFINARVRLWKPMVEDMYKEEFGGDSGVECKSSPKHAPKAARDESWASEDRGEELQDSVTSMAADGGHMGQFRESTPDKINRFTARLGFQNGAHGDDKIDCGLMNLHGDQRPNMDDNRICPEEIITLNHW